MTTENSGSYGWDFFVSYQQADRGWAEWITWQLEAAGHSVLFQLWDAVPGSNWTTLMQNGVSRCSRMIVVLSPAYIDSAFGAAEWQTVWSSDPTGAQRRIIPVRVGECERPGFLRGVVGIDLFGVPEPKALERLQNAIDRALAGRAKPLVTPAFPASSTEGAVWASEASADDSTNAAARPQRRPRFPGVNLRRARGVMVGDQNIQVNNF